MDQETKLAELLKQVERNAAELERSLAAMPDLGELEVAFSRQALVEELGFDAARSTMPLPTCALRA